MAAVVTDALRMARTKTEWQGLFADLSRLAGHRIDELKSKDLYNGRSDWGGVDGAARAEAITAILEWLRGRHHEVFFGAVDKAAFATVKSTSAEVRSLGDEWCAGMTHLVLQFQRAYGGKDRNKGNTFVILDDQVRHRDHFLELVRTPPGWTDGFYERRRREETLTQIVDVPYFANSEHVLLIQVADLVAFILRRRTELAEGRPPKYDDEPEKIEGWAQRVAALAGARRRRWPVRQNATAKPAFEVFASIAPPSLTAL